MMTTGLKRLNRKKVLLIATVDYHFNAFHLPIMAWFQQQGFDVHVAAKGTNELPFCNKRFHVPFERSPFAVENLWAFKQLKGIIDAGEYVLIHCHTPVGGLLGRLAARRARKRGTRVFYTAHGFHFCKGAPLKNWLLFYPIERFLAQFTDCLMTITQEDFALAKRHCFPASQIEYIPGVGVDANLFCPMDENERKKRRLELGYAEDALLLIYAAEFNKNKNQAMLIRALAETKEPRFLLLLAGEGALQKNCRALAEELGVADRVEFLGYRSDMKDLLPLCDVAVASSLREGLPVNVLEAMAGGHPVVAGANRGHQELIVEGETGHVVAPNDYRAMAKRLMGLLDAKRRIAYGNAARCRVAAHYSIGEVMSALVGIYGFEK